MSSSSLWLEVLLASHLAPNAWPPQWHWHARARNRRALHVMAGLVPAIHVLRGRRSKTWMPATSAGMTSRESCVLILLLRLREMAQVRRRLAFSHGHQQAVGAKVIDFLADGDIGVVLGADELAPGWPRVRIAAQIPGHSPWPCQRMVVNRDLVM